MNSTRLYEASTQTNIQSQGQIGKGALNKKKFVLEEGYKKGKKEKILCWGVGVRESRRNI